MQNLPTGTVTLLFTDITGSTRLLTQLGDHYADVLSEYRRVLRAALLYEIALGVELFLQPDASFIIRSEQNGSESTSRAISSPNLCGLCQQRKLS